MPISVKRFVPTCLSALIIALTVAAVAGPQGATSVTKAATPPAAAETRMVVVKLEWIRAGEDGSKSSESESLKVLIGGMASSTSSVARSANMIRNTKIHVREAKEGLIFVDVDYDEVTAASREPSAWDRSVSTSLATKDGATELARSFTVKSDSGKTAESLFFVTASVQP